MGTILTMPSFRTSDGKMFVNEEDSKRHERMLEYFQLIDRAPEQDPNFTKLDQTLLAKYLERNGLEIGKIANKPFRAEIAPQVGQPKTERVVSSVLGTDKTVQVAHIPERKTSFLTQSAADRASIHGIPDNAPRHVGEQTRQDLTDRYGGKE